VIVCAFRAEDDELTILTYGTREPNDIAYYPAPAWWRSVESA